MSLFDTIEGLTKAAVGVVVEAPISMTADLVTLGGAINERGEPYTATTIKKIMENVEHAVKPE